jgi:hypothetical protein
MGWSSGELALTHLFWQATHDIAVFTFV